MVDDRTSSILLLEMARWSPAGSSLIPRVRTHDLRIFALDPFTADLLHTHAVPFRSLDRCEPDHAWEETNQRLFELLSQSAGSLGAGAVLDVFSHYFIWEMNLLFDLLCRIRRVIEDERPDRLIIGVSREASLADELYTVAAELPWEMPLQRWHVGTSPLPSDRVE